MHKKSIRDALMAQNKIQGILLKYRLNVKSAGNNAAYTFQMPIVLKTEIITIDAIHQMRVLGILKSAY